ncbi:hypothetical protein [Aquimarina muelleri]|uniref:Uncharacterized protein n=1 Tax=Aquimarina muelleri TaxID=279356 RepID=A0A918JUW7_9FLAO|nr:hypothetical protein [Aquimarina muelleri]MCX2763574.1 hypothetical protein [Aquimarina muelleri]GGX14499.1 hypothetical protein GCM10007384_15100 [Aquimarina muelleri]
MVSNSLFDLQSIKSDVSSALNSSISDLGNSHKDPNFWAKTSLQTKVESSIQDIARKTSTSGRGYTGNPPDKGFSVTFGIQILVGYKIRVRGNANIGYGNRYGNFGATSSLHISAYNAGLGSAVGKKGLVVNLTAAINLTIGSGYGTPLQSYSLNYNSPIPTLNDFDNSFSYGQLLTWNSALNENQFSLDRIQREGMIGFRLGDVNVSSNNDTKRAYFGGGTDMGWTGGLTVATPFLEIGFQDFSGKYAQEDDKQRKDILERIKETKKNNDLSKFQKEARVSELEGELKKMTSNYHNQTSYHKKLNKASTYIRINNSSGYNATVDLIGDAWLQNAIHKAIKDFRFEYNHKNIEIWGGKK